MFFAYLLMPKERQREMKLKFPEMPFMKKEDKAPEEVDVRDLEDLSGVSLSDIAKSFQKQMDEEKKEKKSTK